MTRLGTGWTPRLAETAADGVPIGRDGAAAVVGETPRRRPISCADTPRARERVTTRTPVNTTGARTATGKQRIGPGRTRRARGPQQLCPTTTYRKWFVARAPMVTILARWRTWRLRVRVARAQEHCTRVEFDFAGKRTTRFARTPPTIIIIIRVVSRAVVTHHYYNIMFYVIHVAQWQCRTARTNTPAAANSPVGRGSDFFFPEPIVRSVAFYWFFFHNILLSSPDGIRSITFRRYSIQFSGVSRGPCPRTRRARVPVSRSAQTYHKCDGGQVMLFVVSTT